MIRRLLAQRPAAPTLRRCSICVVEKPITEFHRRGDSHQWWCKSCRRPYDAAYHARTRSLRLQQRRQRKRRLAEWMYELKTSQPCVDCGGWFHPTAMTFDHLPGKDEARPRQRPSASRVHQACARGDLEVRRRLRELPRGQDVHASDVWRLVRPGGCLVVASRAVATVMVQLHGAFRDFACGARFLRQGERAKGSSFAR